MKRLSIILFALGLAAIGCKSGITEEDTKAMRKEFSEENYEQNMRKAGKGAEFEAEKARQNQHAGGQSSDGS